MTILRAHRATLDRLADQLVEKETLDQSDLGDLLGNLPAWTGAPPAPHVRPVAALPIPLAPTEPAAEPERARKRIARGPKPATRPKPSPA